ncbi:Putative aliphatic sulfonates-binding protein [Methylobacterium crusticola]|uniref:Aliphatic sulfonates-binding protein n=1 Tax=Methylobacterium crusticola TaxID=1697972 RepID=A0ABQ4R150_9HYPH|nr:aliphatic sulfonate ABC transporter substrate-binding protein [Methylobacterium crusticola]GJD51405.1 Putative aliphatic sulfonates-binding protein [Methylobacterium crusticola]
MITRRTALGGLLAGPALAAAPALRAARAAEVPREFRIGYQKSGILVVARQQGTIEARLKALGVESVRWVEFQYGPPIMEALGIGSIDLGAAGDTPPVFAQAAGAKIVYAAATPAQQSAILLPPGSAVADLAGLRAKRIAFAKGSSSHNFVVQALAKAGLTPADVTPAYLNPADAVAAFARGSVDAWAVWDPYFAIAELRHGAKVLTTTQGILASNSFYLANRDFAARAPAVLKAAIEGIRASTEWAAGHRDTLAQTMSEVTGVERAAQQRTVERLTIEVTPVTDRIVASQQAIADTFHALGLVPRAITVRDAVWAAPQS